VFLTLIGYRGSGKTSVAGPLAERLGCAWVDADAELERQAGRSIAAIFETDGEAEFRRRERETIVELLRRDPLVLAAGGGAILNDETRAEMRAAGPVVWLRASVEKLVARIGGDATTGERRPSLSGGGVLDEIAAVLAVREPLYREAATFVVDTDDRTPEAIADEIVARLGVVPDGAVAGGEGGDA
jgi:shikimate kinase